jgi:hypothetical protein
MTTIKGPMLLLLLCFLSTLAFSQSDPVTNQIPNTASKPHRDIQKEDAVANLFDAVRKDAKLHHLSRIKDRIALQQLVCTVSVTDKVPLFPSGFPMLGNTPKLHDAPSALYKTVNPGEVNSELQRIALFEKLRGQGHSPGYARYSVAVWPTQQEIDGKAEYWVGVELFWSAGNEFFLNHFSDAMEWKNEWKTAVVPECRDVR